MISRQFLERVVYDAAANVLSKRPRKKISKFAKYNDAAQAEEKSALSNADESCQLELMRSIGERFKGLGIVAEEQNAVIAAVAGRLFPLGSALREGTYSLLIDPIDGTYNYLHGSPLFGVSVCVLFGREPVVGVIAYPALGIVLSTEKGGGTFINGTPIRIDSRVDYEPEAPVRVSAAHASLVKLREVTTEPTTAARSFVGTLLGLLHSAWPVHDVSHVEAYIAKNVLAYDIGCGALAYTEAGGVALNSAGGICDPFASLYTDVDGEIRVGEFFMLVPSTEYGARLLKHLKNSVNFSGGI